MTYSLRASALLLAALTLAGCNSLTATSAETFALLLDKDRNRIPPELIDNARVDTLWVKAGDAQALFEAPPGSSGRIQWYGLGQQLETDHGRITQLVGMPTEVATPLAAADPFAQGLHGIADGTQVTRTLDLPLSYQTGLQQVATYYRGPLEQINFPGDIQTYQRIDEHIWVPQIHFRAVNHYWVNPKTGKVRRSVQQLAPGLPVFELLFTHQPTGEATP